MNSKKLQNDLQFLIEIKFLTRRRSNPPSTGQNHDVHHNVNKGDIDALCNHEDNPSHDDHRHYTKKDKMGQTHSTLAAVHLRDKAFSPTVLSGISQKRSSSQRHHLLPQQKYCLSFTLSMFTLPSTT
jgi:hypothetical protein